MSCADEASLLEGYEYAVTLQQDVRRAEARLLGRPQTRWHVEASVLDGLEQITLPDMPWRNERRVLLLRLLDQVARTRRTRQRAALIAALVHVVKTWRMPAVPIVPASLVHHRPHTITYERAHPIHAPPLPVVNARVTG